MYVAPLPFPFPPGGVTAPRTWHPDRATDHPGLPSLGQIARRFLPQAVESSIIPAGIFLLVSGVATNAVAILAALAWIVAATAWRSATRRRVSGMAVLSVVRLVARSVIAIAAGSTFLYFVQGPIGGFCLASAFLVSVAIDRPLARRFAEDLSDLPHHVLEHPVVRRVLRRISLTWGLVGLAHAATGLWLLLNVSTGPFVVLNTALSLAVPASLVALSVTWFRRTVLRDATLDHAPR